MPRSAKAEREAEAKSAAEHLAAHAAYVELCEARGLRPLDLGPQWSMICVMWELGPHFIPYLAPTGTVWVRDLRHKTGRRDRPFAAANLAALRAASG